MRERRARDIGGPDHVGCVACCKIFGFCSDSYGKPLDFLPRELDGAVLEKKRSQ